MNFLKIVVVVSTLMVLASPAFSGVLIFDVPDDTGFQPYDFKNESPLIHFEFEELMKEIQNLPRVESVYLELTLRLEDKKANESDLGCLRVCSYHADGELAWDSDHASYTLSHGQNQSVIFDLKKLVGYWIADESHPRKLAVARCKESSRGVRFEGIDFSNVKLRVRYSDPK